MRDELGKGNAHSAGQQQIDLAPAVCDGNRQGGSDAKRVLALQFAQSGNRRSRHETWDAQAQTRAELLRRGSFLAERGELLGLVLGSERTDQFGEIAVHDAGRSCTASG